MKLEIEIAGRVRVVEYAPNEASVVVDGAPTPVGAQVLRPGVLSLIVDGRAWRVVLEDANEPAVFIAGERIPYSVNDPRSLKARRADSAGTDGPRTIKASMPGRVVRVLAQAGDTVAAHQGIVVIEAMKMQNELKSPKDGMVAELRVEPGDTVSAGDVLAVVE
ncbi:MAG: biotin/lipoyl-containing protein [Acidobacteriaceae bacterium]